MSLLARIRSFAARHAMWQPTTPVVAAVSGGSDSVAMLLLLHDLHLAGELQLASVAHCNHQIRPEAAADEAFCRALAARLSLPFVSTAIDVPARARERRESIEVAARQARRGFLEDVRRQCGAERIALAHTRDDQAETLLLRLVRGTGTRGLTGIRPRGGRRVRPLLWATRGDLQAMLVGRGETWQEDATNADLTHPRNRIRHELIPYLARHFNPQVQDALARLGDIARADEAWLTRTATAAAAGLITVSPADVRLDRRALAMLPTALARRVVQAAWTATGAATTAGLAEIDAVLDMARQSRGGAELAGLRAEHSGDFVVLVSRGAVRPASRFCLDLPTPGTVSEPSLGWSLDAEGPMPAAAAERAAAAADEAVKVMVAADGLESPLIVRSRRPGDRLQPFGLGGRHKKVQDLLVDRKVSRLERDHVPIVTDRQDRIIWVVGHGFGEEFRVTAGTKAVILLKLRRI